jgi:RNA polymerase sigma factor (sigma-70 family)
LTASVADLEQLYRGRFHQYLRVAEAIAGSPEAGLDAVQEGFARAIQYRAQFRGEARLSSWVWQCVVNAARAVLVLHNETLNDDLEGAVLAEEPLPPNIRGAIAALPERQRLTLFLRYYADMDYASIAQVLGIDVGTVGATLNKAHAALRRQLQEVAQ